MLSITVCSFSVAPPPDWTKYIQKKSCHALEHIIQNYFRQQFWNKCQYLSKADSFQWRIRSVDGHIFWGRHWRMKPATINISEQQQTNKLIHDTTTSLIRSTSIRKERVNLAEVKRSFDSDEPQTYWYYTRSKLWNKALIWFTKHIAILLFIHSFMPRSLFSRAPLGTFARACALHTNGIDFQQKCTQRAFWNCGKNLV